MSNVKEQKSIAGLRANAVAFLVSISFFYGTWAYFFFNCIDFRRRK